MTTYLKRTNADLEGHCRTAADRVRVADQELNEALAYRYEILAEAAKQGATLRHLAGICDLHYSTIRAILQKPPPDKT